MTKQEAKEFWVAYVLPEIGSDPYWHQVSWISYLAILQNRYQITSRQMNAWSKTIPEKT